MKSIIFIVIFIIVPQLNIFCGTINAHNGYAKVYSDFSKTFKEKPYSVLLDSIDEKLYLCFKQDNIPCTIYISKENIEKLRLALEKYLEWELLATTDKDVLNKPIPNTSILASIAWNKYGKDYFDDEIIIEFHFLSQNIYKHQLVFAFSSLNIELNYIYLDKPELDLLNESVKKESLTTLITEFNKYQ